MPYLGVSALLSEYVRVPSTGTASKMSGVLYLFPVLSDYHMPGTAVLLRILLVVKAYLLPALLVLFVCCLLLWSSGIAKKTDTKLVLLI